MPCLRPIDVHIRTTGHSYLVPCGKCDECFNRRKMSYVFRIEQEKLHGSFKYAHMVTLSYKDEYLPYESYSLKCKGSPVNPVSTGESLLCPYDLTQFLKRYRQFTNGEIKYFAAGEYGKVENTHRPHWHIILFTNDDWKTCVRNSQLAWSYLVAETKQERNARYRLSRKLKRHINRDSRSMRNRDLIGRVNVRCVTYRRMCYCAKYCIKQLFKDEVVPPSVRLSNGLGRSFLDSDTAQLCMQYNRHFTFFRNGLPVAIPRYFSHRIFTKEQMDDFTLQIIIQDNPEILKSDGSLDFEAIREFRNDREHIKEVRVKQARMARYGLSRFFCLWMKN